MNRESLTRLIEDLNFLAAQLTEPFDKLEIEQLYDQHFNSDMLGKAMEKYIAFFDANQIKTVQEYDNLLTLVDDDVLDELAEAERSLEAILLKCDEALLKVQHSRIAMDFDAVEVWCSKEGKYRTVSSYLRSRESKYTLIVMMRYSGCFYCGLHVAAVQDSVAKFENRSCDVVVVSKGTPMGGTKWKARMGIDLPLLLDDKMQFVFKFGYKRSAHALLKPVTLLELTELVLTVPPDQIGGPDTEDMLADTFQMGGDMLVENSTLSIVHDYRGQVASDTPSVDYLTRLLDDLSAAQGERPKSRPESVANSGERVQTAPPKNRSKSRPQTGM